MTLLHRVLNLPARVLYLSLFLVATGLLSFGQATYSGLGAYAAGTIAGTLTRAARPS